MSEKFLENNIYKSSNLTNASNNVLSFLTTFNPLTTSDYHKYAIKALNISNKNQHRLILASRNGSKAINNNNNNNDFNMTKEMFLKEMNQNINSSIEDIDLDQEHDQDSQQQPSDLNHQAKLIKQEMILNDLKVNDFIQPDFIQNSNRVVVKSDEGGKSGEYLTKQQRVSNSLEDPSEKETTTTKTNKNTLLLNSATTDHSKDYTSSESEDSNNDDYENNSQTTRRAKLLSHSELALNTANSSPLSLQKLEPGNSKNALFYRDNKKLLPTLSKSGSYFNSSLDEDQSNILVAPLEMHACRSNMSTNETDEINEKCCTNLRSSSNNDITNTNNAEPFVNIDLSIFDLLDKTSKKFVLKPASLGLTVQCQIYRQKGLYPRYRFYMENSDGNLLLLMTARKKKKAKTPCYVINTLTYDLSNLEKYIETPVAKLKSNLLGTYFRLYDFGVKPSPVIKKARSASFFRSDFAGSSENLNTMSIKHQSFEIYSSEKNAAVNESVRQMNALVAGSDKNSCRKEYLSLIYQLNMLGFKGPRQMCVLVPGMDSQYNREDFFLSTEADSLCESWRKIEANLKYPIPVVSNTTPKSTPSVDLNSQAPIIKKGSVDLNSSKNTVKSKLTSIKRSLYQLNILSSQNGEEVASKSSVVITPSSSEALNESGSGVKLSSSAQNVDNKKSSSKSYNYINNTNVVKLINKPPEWHKELKSFALDFNGRVTLPSSKNFQIAHEANVNYVVMQFGKVNQDLFTCDYSYPFCALQAFGVALSSLKDKLGCD